MKIKMIDELKTTSNPAVYRKSFKRVVSKKNGLCSLCGYHVGENTRSIPHKSWKFRAKKKHQYD